MSNEIDIIYRRLAEQKGRIEALEKGRAEARPDKPVDAPFQMKCVTCGKVSSFSREQVEKFPTVCTPECNRAFQMRRTDAPTREAIARVIYDFRYRDVPSAAHTPADLNPLDYEIADAILAAFGPKLGRQLTEDDWYMILSDTCTLSKEDETAPKNLMVVLAKAVVAKLAELKQDVKMVVSAIPTVSDHPNRFQLASIIGKTMSAWQSSSDDLRIADAILAVFGPKLSSMPTAEQMHQKWNTCDGPGVRESWVQFHAWLAKLSQPKMRRELSVDQWERLLFNAWKSPGGFAAMARAVLATLAELSQPIELDANELAKLLNKQVGYNWEIIGEATRDEYRCFARAVIAHVKERMNVTTAPPVPASVAGDCGPDCPGNPVVNAPATHRTVGSPAPTVVISEQKVQVVNPPPDAGIEERAKRLIVFFDAHYRFEYSARRADWLAVSRAVEDEIRAAKREALETARKTLFALTPNPNDTLRDVVVRCHAIVRGMIADLDEKDDGEPVADLDNPRPGA